MILGGLMLCLSLLLTLEVVLRSVFGTSLTWSYEIARTMMIWMVYLGGVLLALDKRSIKITLLEDKYPTLGKINHAIMWVTHLTVGLISVNFLSLIIPYARSSSTTGLPIWINYLIIPAAFFAMLLSKPSHQAEDIC